MLEFTPPLYTRLYKRLKNNISNFRHAELVSASDQLDDESLSFKVSKPWNIFLIGKTLKRASWIFLSLGAVVRTAMPALTTPLTYSGFTLSKNPLQGGKIFAEQTAFTLAEVLITLVIIGIIAAITVPVIQTNIRKKATLTQLKKGYSVMSQIIKRSELDNGPIETWDFIHDSSQQEGNNTDFFKKYFAPYINSVNQTGSKSTEKFLYVIHNIDGDVAINMQVWDRLPDGSSFSVYSMIDYGYCWIFYDVNNSNGPNKLGKDIFMFEIKAPATTISKFGFWGSQFTNEELNLTPNYACKKGTKRQFAGGFCGTLIQRNNWEFPDGYPW